MQVPYPGRQIIEADLPKGMKMEPYPGHRFIVTPEGRVQQVPKLWTRLVDWLVKAARHG